MTLEDELTSASANGNTAGVRALLERGARVNGRNRFGQSALQVMMMGSTSVAQLLLDHGADPNMADGRTEITPLHDAAREGFLETVRLLVRHHADPLARDKFNHLPVDLARQSGHGDVVHFLENLQNGHDL